MQADSPTVLRDSLKGVFAIAANMSHDVVSIDITGAFLQGEDLMREVFIEPPTDIKKHNRNILWKLKKPLYGLKDASRNFYFSVPPILEREGFIVSAGDQASFYKNIDGRLVAQVALHVDNFIITGKEEL